MCNDFDKLDDICCPLREKSIFLASWTLAHAIILIHFVFFYSTRTAGDNLVLNLSYSVIMMVAHVLGTIFLFVGIYKEHAFIFLLGIIFSSIYPYLQFFMIYLPAVQIIFTITSCKYYKTMKGENN
ncbi:hypothetical protein ACLKA7_003615 [Drosophila subpalustris]